MSQRSNRFAAFEFSEDDEKVEWESAAVLARFKKNPKKCCTTHSPLTKYFQCFMRGRRARKKKNTDGPVDINEEQEIKAAQMDSRHDCSVSDFKEVIFPKGDPDAILVTKSDVERLQPEVFINDTIIDFYIKYLQSRIQPIEQHRFHFFNSFFFRKFADPDKGLLSHFQARAAFQRVRKWTMKVNIFAKDYIFVPVNYRNHWSLIVICHPGEVTNIKEDETQTFPRVPCILHMNSIRGSHRGIENLFQSYLSEEWMERHRDAADDIPSKFLRLQFVPLELPQQENKFDCGLFLLHYVELFLQQAPVDFNRQSSNFLNKDWFPPADVSLKRPHIRKLIFEMSKEQPHSSMSVGSSSLLPSRSEQEIGLQSIEEQIGALEI